MIGRKKFVGYGIGINDAEQDALARLNGFIVNGGYRIVDTKVKDGRNNGAYWCEVELLYEYYDYEEE